MEIAKCTDQYKRDVSITTGPQGVGITITPNDSRPSSHVALTPEQALVMAKALEMGARKVRG